MHKIIITGNLTKEVELKTTSTNKQVANLPVAVNDGYGDKQVTTYYNVSVWNKSAENASNILNKGDKVLIEGTPSADAYLDRNGEPKASMKIIAMRFEKLSSSFKNEKATTPAKPSVPEVQMEDLDDDEPF